MSETLIELRNVVKKYDDVAVVNNLSLEIKKGEIFGFLGPNGGIIKTDKWKYIIQWKGLLIS